MNTGKTMNTEERNEFIKTLATVTVNNLVATGLQVIVENPEGGSFVFTRSEDKKHITAKIIPPTNEEA